MDSVTGTPNDSARRASNVASWNTESPEAVWMSSGGRPVRSACSGSRSGALFLTALVMGGSSLFFSLYLQDVQGLTPLAAACWSLPQIVFMIAAANVGPWLNRRFAQPRLVTVMLLLMTGGFLLFAVVPTTSVGRP